MIRAAVLMAILGAASAAEARRGGPTAYFLFDASPGVEIPIGNGDYTDLASTTFRSSLRLGAEIWFNRTIGIAPEVDFDFGPFLFSSRYPSDYNPHWARLRGLGGMRLLIGFGPGAFFFRFVMGIDGLVGQYPNSDSRTTYSSFTVEPSFGVQFRFLRHGIVGATVDFPIAFDDDPALVPRDHTALQVDCALMFFIGIRI
jgi:hypothetical protein